MSVRNSVVAGPPAKIQTLAELALTIESLRQEGRKVVLCHGVFDLLHIGHIRHFTEAKAMGDVLVVTLTEDRHVNKGPHRPAFTEGLRAEALAALGMIDYVAVSRHPDAQAVILQLRPDVYAKGPDYKNAATDVTGGILKEREAIESIGGTIAFTEDVTYSSSALLNRHWRMFDDDVERYLQEFRSRHSAREVIEHLERLATMRVVVVGEAILDEYVYCDQLGKSAKDPVLAMRFESAEVFAGGALAVANHLAGFCRSVELVSYLGTNGDGHENLVRSGLKPNVRPNFIYKKNSPTILKRRYIERVLFSKLFELYMINDEPITAEEESVLGSLLEARLENADLVVAADFGHGLITPRIVGQLAESDRFLAVNTQVNAANIRFHAISNYRRADYVCINEGELRLDARNRTAPLGDLIGGLNEKLNCKRFLVTRGKSGVSYFDDGSQVDSPSFALNVVDRIGSGDAVLAITSACAATDTPPDVLAFLANVIGALKVQIMGNRASVDRVAAIKFIESLLK
ncbi:MAG: adenylyltransferase/cytidyltransferase family protein [Candidatus Eremiobacteraeota bacterium]|nr:adenylyltransferase/cytidyltransferase family protein [Candidatus Eremiobacteraeota bacterium]